MTVIIVFYIYTYFFRQNPNYLYKLTLSEYNNSFQPKKIQL